MAKGKKTVIKEIKKLTDNEVLINGKEYVVLDTSADILTAKTMKISSNGNRILRFENEKQKATIDVKRNLNIVKYIFKDAQRAKNFKKSNDKSILRKDDLQEVVKNTNCYTTARDIISSFTTKGNASFDKNTEINTFYLLEEV